MRAIAHIVLSVIIGTILLYALINILIWLAITVG